MSNLSTIEQRLAAVENDVSVLKHKLSENGSNAHWLERFIGSFRDDPHFDEAVRLGNEYRRSQRPDTHG